MSTCRGAAAPHLNCPYGEACDWQPRERAEWCGKPHLLLRVSCVLDAGHDGPCQYRRPAVDGGFITAALVVIAGLAVAAALVSVGVAVGTTTVDTIPVPGPTVYVETPGPVRTIEVTRAPRASRSQDRTAERTKQRVDSAAAKPSKAATSSRDGHRTGLNLKHEALWQTIADCETGERQKNGLGKPGTARWDARDGAYDGALQFLPSTWLAWGGADFAPHAYQASRAEQITVANRSGRTDPWLKPWPICGKRAAQQLGVSFP